MGKLIFYYIIVIFGIFASSCSQLLLKKSAVINNESLIGSFLNWRVALAYVILLGSLVVNISALGHGVNVKDLPILESLGYVFVPFLSYIVLKEKISKKTFLSMTLIIVGIIVFYL